MNTITGPRLLIAAVLAYLLFAGYPVLQKAWTIPEAQAGIVTQIKILGAIEDTNELLGTVISELQEIRSALESKKHTMSIPISQPLKAMPDNDEFVFNTDLDNLVEHNVSIFQARDNPEPDSYYSGRIKSPADSPLPEGRDLIVSLIPKKHVSDFSIQDKKNIATFVARAIEEKDKDFKVPIEFGAHTVFYEPVEQIETMITSLHKWGLAKPERNRERNSHPDTD